MAARAVRTDQQRHAAPFASALQRGGKLIIFGNGGSATDANDWAIDCVAPPTGYRPIPAVSLSLEPANITAIANDVGTELIFLRQFIAQARPDDVAIAISTSGGSRNIIMALEEARKREYAHRRAAWLRWRRNHCGAGLADFPLVVHSDYIPRIQEVQASIYHVIRESLGGACPWPKFELFGTRGCPYTQEMREWLEWRGAEFVEYDVEADRGSPRTHARPRRRPAHRAGPVEDGKVMQIGWQGRGCVMPGE